MASLNKGGAHQADTVRCGREGKLFGNRCWQADIAIHRKQMQASHTVSSQLGLHQNRARGTEESRATSAFGRHPPFGVLCLQQIQVRLPLVANHLAAGEAPERGGQWPGRQTMQQGEELDLCMHRWGADNCYALVPTSSPRNTTWRHTSGPSAHLTGMIMAVPCKGAAKQLPRACRQTGASGGGQRH